MPLPNLPVLGVAAVVALMSVAACTDDDGDDTTPATDATVVIGGDDFPLGDGAPAVDGELVIGGEAFDSPVDPLAVTRLGATEIQLQFPLDQWDAIDAFYDDWTSAENDGFERTDSDDPNDRRTRWSNGRAVGDGLRIVELSELPFGLDGDPVAFVVLTVDPRQG